MLRAFVFGGIAVGALVGFAFFATCSPEVRPEPQHVMLIVIDTLRADHLHVYGYERETSPVIDKLASEGVRFERAISQASFTSPSMVSLMTGHYIAKERLDIPKELTTLAETFQKGGWATAAFVSNPLINADNGFARGFDRFERIDEYGSNESVAQWLRESKGRKTLTYIHITEPHDPYTPPEAQRPFRAKKDLLPGDRAQYYDQITRAMGLANSAQQIEHIKEEIGGYDDDVRYADARVGEFLTALEVAGVRATTAIALTADHGEGLWEHVALMNGQRGRKLREGEAPSLTNALMPTHGNQVHQELVHVPLLLVAPGLERGKVVQTPVENLDLFPTLLELANVRSPGGLQGSSLLRAIEGETGIKDSGFSFTRFNATVVANDGMKLIVPTDEGACAEALETELFDLKNDPFQRHNIATEHPEVVKRLTALAAQRIKIAISEGSEVSVTNIVHIRGLGYDGLEEQESLRSAMQATETGPLLTKLCSFNTPCSERLAAADALAKRQLDDTARTTLREWRAKETSAAVQRVLDGILAK